MKHSKINLFNQFLVFKLKLSKHVRFKKDSPIQINRLYEAENYVFLFKTTRTCRYSHDKTNYLRNDTG